MSGPALVVGFRGSGAVRRAVGEFGRCGFAPVYVLMDRGANLDGVGVETRQTLVRQILNAGALARAIRRLSLTRAPAICVHDRSMFSFLAAMAQIEGAALCDYHTPVEGLYRSRLKPYARRVLSDEEIDHVRYAVVRHRESIPDWARKGSVVKPLSGMASEMVRVCATEAEVRCAVRELRAYSRRQGYSNGTVRIHALEQVFDIASDALVEEVIRGQEFTVDGYLENGRFACVVQHKEERFCTTFVGEGLTTCPPDERLVSSLVQRSIAEFAEAAVRALGLSNWVFHMEVMHDGARPHLIELNPRAAGGLLWKTAQHHLGVDPAVAMVRLHLRRAIDALEPQGGVTGHLPIYAEADETRRPRVIWALRGLKAARRIPGVVNVLESTHRGERITSFGRENYLAFVEIQAATHAEVRQIAANVRATVGVVYRRR